MKRSHRPGWVPTRSWILDKDLGRPRCEHIHAIGVSSLSQVCETKVSVVLEFASMHRKRRATVGNTMQIATIPIVYHGSVRCEVSGEGSGQGLPPRRGSLEGDNDLRLGGPLDGSGSSIAAILTTTSWVTWIAMMGGSVDPRLQRDLIVSIVCSLFLLTSEGRVVSKGRNVDLVGDGARGSGVRGAEGGWTLDEEVASKTIGAGGFR